VIFGPSIFSGSADRTMVQPGMEAGVNRMSTLARPRFRVHDETRRGPERRFNDRWSLDGVAIAHETGGAGFGRRHALRLIDGSPDGVGAITASPLTPGTTLVLSFSSPGGRTVRGTVIRCLPGGRGYRLAVRLEGRAAA
jgi:hypothetical protein